MNKMINITMLLVLAMAGSAAAQMPVAPNTISVVPSYQLADVGDTVNVDIDITAALMLTTFEVQMGFDPAILQFEDMQNGGFLGTAPGTICLGPTEIGPGQVLFSCIQQMVNIPMVGPMPPSGVTGDGTLATMQFTAIGEGISPVDIESATITGTMYMPSSSTNVDGAVEVIGDGDDDGGNDVPEFSAVGAALALLGAAGFVAYKKRK
ncbi:LPXTG cell wall anchor domain-containing protein [Candidatus Woesearchaeota archaeon]|nr:LPXTG cell wall anchor domain-containing protein [Candidatus Woesearchaeota archaeon]